MNDLFWGDSSKNLKKCDTKHLLCSLKLNIKTMHVMDQLVSKFYWRFLEFLSPIPPIHKTIKNTNTINSLAMFIDF